MCQLFHLTGRALLAAIALTPATAQATPQFEFRFNEKPGPYPVGLRVVERNDISRSFEIPGAESGKPIREGQRPLQTLEWYPAEASGRKQMTLGDYADLIKTETSFGKPVENGKPQSFIAQYMHGVTERLAWAVRDAEFEQGRFPIAIYAPSVNAPATENIELCEYLASQGFVVIASPSMGAEGRTMTVDLAGARAEARDISFLIDSAKTLPDTDLSAVAVIGYSWGGMAALFAAARDTRIDALVSLDGSFRYSPGTVKEAGDVRPDRMTIPLLVFSRAEETLETWDAMNQNKTQGGSAPNVLNQWTHGDLLHVRLLAISHIQFSSLYQRSERFGKEALQFSPADYSLQEGAVSYNWMVRYTAEFLKAYLKHDETASLFLRRTPQENGVPAHLMASSFRAAIGKPAIGDTPPAH